MIIPFCYVRSYSTCWNLTCALHLLLIEIVYDDTDEEIEWEKSTEHDEYAEIKIVVERVFVRWLYLNSSDIYRVVHNFQPSFECRNLHKIRKCRATVYICGLYIQLFDAIHVCWQMMLSWTFIIFHIWAEFTGIQWIRVQKPRGSTAK